MSAHIFLASRKASSKIDCFTCHFSKCIEIIDFPCAFLVHVRQVFSGVFVNYQIFYVPLSKYTGLKHYLFVRPVCVTAKLICLSISSTMLQPLSAPFIIIIAHNFLCFLKVFNCNKQKQFFQYRPELGYFF